MSLDVQIYDQQKQVSVELSRSVFSSLKHTAAGAIRDNLGTVLEIGAGTGLLTVGMLADSAFDRAVITDISPEMLAVCRARVEANVHEAERISFAIYDGHAKLFEDCTFDLCIAHSVLHHVADYRSLLADVCRMLKPGGVAIFVDPGEPYHDAMSRAMADALCELIAAERSLDADAIKMADWVADVRYRLAFPGSERISLLEDKHLFTRDGLAAAAADAGYTGITILPNHLDPAGALGVREYIKELALSERFATPFFAVYQRYADRHFRGVATEDQTGMYVCIFRR